MAIIETITDSSHFYRWISEQKYANSSYGNCFSYEGAKALQEYLEELSNETGENIEFDPIAWCVEYSEYTSFENFQHDTGYTKDGIETLGYPDIKDIEGLRDNTTVIEFDGGFVIADF